MEASRLRGNPGVPAPRAAAHIGTPPTAPNPANGGVRIGAPHCGSYASHERPSPRSALSPLESPSDSFGTNHPPKAAAVSCVPEANHVQRGKAAASDASAAGSDGHYDAAFLRTVAAQLQVPRSGSAQEPYSTDFLKHKAAELQGMSKSATTSPAQVPSGAYDISFLKSKAAEALSLPEPASSSPSQSYDINFLKTKAAEALRMPKSASAAPQPESYDVTFLKTKAAEAQSIPKSASSGPQSYDVSFLRTKAAEAQSIPKSASAAPQSYDITFLKSKAAEVQSLPKSHSASPPSYDIQFLKGKAVKAAQVLPKSASASPQPYDVSFLKSKAAEAQSLPKSASSDPQSYTVDFLKQKAAEIQTIPKSATTASYDVNFLKQVATEAQSLPKSASSGAAPVPGKARGGTSRMAPRLPAVDESIPAAVAAAAAAGQAKKEFLRNKSRDDMFVEIERDRSWVSSQSHGDEVESFGMPGEGHVWVYDDEDMEYSPTVESGDHRRGKSFTEEPTGARERLAHHQPKQFSSLDSVAEERAHLREVGGGPTRPGSAGGHGLQRNFSRDDMSLPLPKPTWQPEAGPRGATRGSPNAKKLLRNMSKDDMHVAAPKPNWGSAVSKSPVGEGSPAGGGAPTRRVLDRVMSKDDMYLPPQKSRVQSGASRPGGASGVGASAKARQVKLNRTTSKCDLSIVAPKPRWEAHQLSPAIPSPMMKKPSAEHNTQNPIPRARLGRQLSKDDVDMLARRAEQSRGAHSMGQAPPSAAAPAAAGRIQSRVVKKGGYVQEIRVAASSSSPLLRDASRGGVPTPKGPNTPKAMGINMLRGAAVVHTPKGHGPPATPKNVRKDPKGGGTQQESGSATPREGSKGARALGRLPSKDDMYVDVLQQQWLQGRAQGSFVPAPGNRPSRTPAVGPAAPLGTSGLTAPVVPSPSVGAGAKKLQRNMSDDSIVADDLLEEFHRRRLKEKGLPVQAEGSKGGKRATAGVRRIESKAVKVKAVGGKGK